MKNLVNAVRGISAASLCRADRPPPPRIVVDLPHARVQLMAAVQDCRLAVEKLLDLHSSSVFAAGNPLGRFWRDLAVGTRHGAVNPWAAATTTAAS